MAAIQTQNNNNYQEFVNELVKDITESNLFWSDDDKKLCYNRWLTIHSEQLKQIPPSDRTPHVSAFAENHTEAVDDEKKRKLNELLAASDSQIIKTTKRRKRCPLKCAQSLAKQCKYECTFVQKQKTVLRKNESSTLNSNVIRRHATNAIKATSHTVKSLVELSKCNKLGLLDFGIAKQVKNSKFCHYESVKEKLKQATTKHALLHSQLVAAKKFTAANTVSRSVLRSEEAQTAESVDASNTAALLTTENAEHYLGKSSATLKTIEYNVFEAHRGYREPYGTIL